VNTRKSIPATPPEDIAKVIAGARAHSATLGLYLWLVAITGQRPACRSGTSTWTKDRRAATYLSRSPQTPPQSAETRRQQQLEQPEATAENDGMQASNLI
jgi:hypothetical protein